MTQTITATFIDGVLKPLEELGLPSGTRVRLVVDLCDQPPTRRDDAMDELDRLCEEFPIESRTPHLTRDDLHDRG